jgi:hypothetical protein
MFYYVIVGLGILYMEYSLFKNLKTTNIMIVYNF